MTEPLKLFSSWKDKVKQEVTNALLEPDNLGSYEEKLEALHMFFGGDELSKL